MSTSDTLAATASANLFETAKPHFIAKTVFRAPQSPSPIAEGALLRGGIVKAELDKPESPWEGVRLVPYPKQVAPEKIRYYDLKRNWTKKIEPYLDDKELNDVLARDFNKFTMGDGVRNLKERITSCLRECVHFLRAARAICEISVVYQARSLSLAREFYFEAGNFGGAESNLENHYVGRSFYCLEWTRLPI